MEMPLRDELHIASTKKRLGAFVIDDIVISVFLLIIFFDQLISITDPMALSIFLEKNFMLFLLLKVLYQSFFVWQGGMTPGKMVMKIRVVELDTGYTPRFSKALLRALVRVLSESIFYLGYLMAYFNPLVQTLHDKLSQTVVVDA